MQATQHLKVNWLNLGLAFAAACVLARTSTRPAAIIVATILIALALISFCAISAFCLKRLKADGSQEVIAVAVWMGAWLIPCAFLSRGWIIFGLMFACCGYMLLMAQAKDVEIDFESDDTTTIRQKMIRQQLAVEYKGHIDSIPEIATNRPASIRSPERMEAHPLS